MDWGYVTGYFDGEGSAGMFRSKGTHGTMKGWLVWTNTHRASLEQIRAFIGCGNLRVKRHPGTTWKDCYSLNVERRQDLLMVIPHMIPHSIIKQDALIAVLRWATDDLKDAPPGRGNLVAAGAEEIRRLYWDEKLTQAQIAKRFGVVQTAVRHYMKRHGIPTRTRTVAARMANRESVEWEHRSATLAALRRAQWQDPDYRERMSAAMKGGQARSVAAGRRFRGPRGPLGEAGIEEILRLRDDGLTLTQIGERFGVTQPAVSHFIRRHSHPVRRTP